MKTINLVIGAAVLATFANCKNEESKEAQVEEQQKVKTVAVPYCALPGINETAVS